MRRFPRSSRPSWSKPRCKRPPPCPCRAPCRSLTRALAGAGPAGAADDAREPGARRAGGDRPWRRLRAQGRPSPCQPRSSIVAAGRARRTRACARAPCGANRRRGRPADQRSARGPGVGARAAPGRRLGAPRGARGRRARRRRAPRVGRARCARVGAHGPARSPPRGPARPPARPPARARIRGLRRKVWAPYWGGREAGRADPGWPRQSAAQLTGRRARRLLCGCRAQRVAPWTRQASCTSPLWDGTRSPFRRASRTGAGASGTRDPARRCACALRPRQRRGSSPPASPRRRKAGGWGGSAVRANACTYKEAPARRIHKCSYKQAPKHARAAPARTAAQRPGGCHSRVIAAGSTLAARSRAARL
jgi:hypothetical protein